MFEREEDQATLCYAAMILVHLTALLMLIADSCYLYRLPCQVVPSNSLRLWEAAEAHPAFS